MMFWISYIIIALLVGIDQLTKFIAVSNLTYLEKIEFIPHLFNFTLVYNKGAGFSILSDAHWLLVIISVVASIVLLWLCRKNSFKKGKMIYSISMTLITAGTMGNLIDRVFFEEGVIDFIQFAFWTEFPVFNVADSLLTVGVGLLAIYLLFIYKEPKKEEIKEDVE